MGRSAACYLRIPDLRVSSEHARLSWTGSCWVLRDLGSRNGTFVNGRPVAVGQSVEVGAGDELSFGDSSLTWLLLDASGPVPTARDPATGEIRAARDGLLRLGPAEEPLPYLHAVGSEAWVLEEVDGARLVKDGDVVSAGGRSWVLHLAEPHSGTIESEHRARWLGDLGWRFAVSADEEFVEVSVVEGDSTHVLGSRAHHYLLLTLARARAEDGSGWVYSDRLARRLGLEETSLNVQIYRAREELGRLGIADGSEVIERRRGTGQIRTGIVHFTEHRT